MKIEKGKVGFIQPMLAVAVIKLPEGAAWSYELELETLNQDTASSGYRLGLAWSLERSSK